MIFGMIQLFQWSWNYKRNHLKKHIKKRISKKGIINLTVTIHQINMNFDNFVSSNNSFKSHINAKGFNMLLTWLKHASHQKAESFKAASPSNLDNIIINNSSNFNTKCWILYKMVGAPSFSQPILWIQPTLQSYQETVPFLQSIFTSLNSPLLAYKIILTIPTNTLFLYNSAMFHLPPFAYNHPNNPHKKYFPCLKYFGNSGCVKGPGS